MENELNLNILTPKEHDISIKLKLNNEDTQNENKDSYIIIRDFPSENRTEYFSAQSFLFESINDIQINFKEEFLKPKIMNDSFDSKINDNTETVDKNIYNSIREYIENEDFTKLKDLQNKILKEEIKKRKEKNNKRVLKFNKLQDKMNKLDRNSTFSNNENQNLVLTNIDPLKGYYIKPLDDVIKEYGYEQDFCGFKFFSK